ncbi:MAG: YihY/virulence factor BrkB family protein [Acidimicrobiales bacterium]
MTLDFGRKLLTEWREDRVPDLAAEVAFYAILSLFPAFLALASILGALDSLVGADVAQDVEDQVLDFLRRVLTPEAESTIEAAQELFVESSPGLFTFSLLTAVWTLSRGFAALVRALDVVYDLDELRPWLKIRGTALLLAVGSTIAGAIMLTLLIVGPLIGTGEDIATEVGLGDQFVFLWDVVRLPLAFVVLVLWAAIVFHIAPAHHTPWRSDVPGAIVTGVLWVAFSAGLNLYVQFAQSGNAVFGALGGALIVLLWFWLLALAVMIGGEVNQLLIQDQYVDSEFIQSSAERAYEVAGVDRAAAVEEDAHDGRGHHDPI